MIPLIVSEPELALVTDWVREVAAETFAASDDGDVDYIVGTMVETPRAVLARRRGRRGGRVLLVRHQRPHPDDVSGSPRDDVEGRFMAEYIELKLLSANPFETLDQEGVGQLVRMAVERGRATRPDLHLGICGEHGGDPASIAFFGAVGLDYVSCSPYRVPIARLAAAHAALGAGRAGLPPGVRSCLTPVVSLVRDFRSARNIAQ